MFAAEFYTGFGLSIEANDNVCYFVHDDEDSTVLIQFDGIIINLPFVKIHIGSFHLVED